MDKGLQICTDQEALDEANEKLKKECDRTKTEMEKVFQKHEWNKICRGELDKQLPTDIDPGIVDMLLILRRMEKQA
jgi:hypothetical protein